MATLSTRTEIRRDVLRRLADERLAEFRMLRAGAPPHYAGALYLAGYAVEALLKCIICKNLDLDELPVLFHIHDVYALLFFSGRYREMRADAAVWDSLLRIQAAWSEKRRYSDPPTVTVGECADMDRWLSDPLCGVVPWLKARL